MQPLKHISGIFSSISGNRARILLDGPEFSEYTVVIPETFLTSLTALVPGTAVSLVHVNVDTEQRELVPALVVVFPDYLLDVSAVAECMRDYGSHPYYYFINRLEEKSNTAPILIGNAANFFLDVFLHAEEVDKVDLTAVLKSFFQRNAIELSSCAELNSKEKEADFFQKCSSILTI